MLYNGCNQPGDIKKLEILLYFILLISKIGAVIEFCAEMNIFVFS